LAQGLIGLAGGLRYALAAGGLVLWSHAAAAQTAPLPRGAERAPAAIAPLLGAWTLEQAGASRQCTVTLGAEPAGQGRQIRFPATCRRALPILDGVRAWSLSPEGEIGFSDAGGKPVIRFGAAIGQRRQGRGSDGRDYALDATGSARAAPRSLPGQAETAATAAQRPTLVDPARAPAPDTLPGLYALMRQPGREACRLRLAAPAAGQQGTARFDGLCADTGITIFDPVGWRYDAGRLTLLARKGHSVELVFENGQWRKDPAVGAPLLLRRSSP
jgi:hypothetical protein